MDELEQLEKRKMLGGFCATHVRFRELLQTDPIIRSTVYSWLYGESDSVDDLLLQLVYNLKESKDTIQEAYEGHLMAIPNPVI